MGVSLFRKPFHTKKAKGIIETPRDSGMKAITTSWSEFLTAKLTDYAQLVKFRLSATVVFSAVIGYAVAATAVFSWLDVAVLISGGFLITAAANALNQYIERDTDKLMVRTATRPLPAGRMTFIEAILAAGVMAVTGLTLIGLYFNEVGALVGAIALLSYAFVYTPLKKAGPLAVFIGAIPGALPPVIGYVCVTGHLGAGAVVLFTIQFLWQFIHFWAIAWLADSDYAKAGFRMLPSPGGKDKASTMHIMAFALLLSASGILPWLTGIAPAWTAVMLSAIGLVVFATSVKLFDDLSDRSARRLLLTSFIYLPVVFVVIALS